MSTATPTFPLPRPGAGSLPTLIERATRRHRRRRLTRWISFALAAVLLVALGVVVFRPKPIPFEQRFRTASVTRGDVVRDVRATGRLEAQSTVDVGAEISGKLAEVLVDFNDEVRAGQPLARFDRTSIAAQVAQTEAAVAAASAALEQARVDALSAQQGLARADALFRDGTLSPADHDAAVNSSKIAAARVQAGAAQLAAQRAALAIARTNLDHTVVRSPIDGIVIARKVDPGQTVVSALASPVLFQLAADLRRMKVVAAVDEADVGEVRDGQRANFSVNAWPDRSFEGRVVEVRNAPEVVQDVVTYGTVVEVDNPDLALKPGMTASVRIRTAATSAALRVPNGALRFSPPGEKPGDGKAVWILSRGEITRVPVTSGITDGESTVVSGALAPDARVVVDLTAAGKKAYGIPST